MIAIELYGVSRWRAGISVVKVEASTIGEALHELGRLCPNLNNGVLDEGALHEAFQLSLNGDCFVSDSAIALRDGDVLLLLSADAGG